MAEEKSYKLAYTGSEVDQHLAWPAPIAGGGTGDSVRRTSVTVGYDTSVASNHSFTVYYYPYLKMCFVRGYAKIDNKSSPARQAITIATIPEGYRPTYTAALALSIYGTGSAKLSSAGSIIVAPEIELKSTTYYDVYVSGWWLVSSS